MANRQAQQAERSRASIIRRRLAPAEFHHAKSRANKAGLRRLARELPDVERNVASLPDRITPQQLGERVLAPRDSNEEMSGKVTSTNPPARATGPPREENPVDVACARAHRSARPRSTSRARSHIAQEACCGSAPCSARFPRPALCEFISMPSASYPRSHSMRTSRPVLHPTSTTLPPRRCRLSRSI